MPSSVTQQTKSASLDSSVYIDSHCHFDFSDFDADRENVWLECNKRGVHAVIIPGVSLDEYPRAKEICDSLSGCYFSVGVHPWWIDELLKSISAGQDGKPLNVKNVVDGLREKHLEALKSKKCVAIGECGLDKTIRACADLQYEVFDYQLKLAKEHNKPLIIHSRKTHDQVLRHIKNISPNSGGVIHGVIHGFSGSEQIAKDYVGCGFFLGVGGTLTYKRAKKTREAIKKIPLEYLVLETDAPSMPIQGRQGSRNSPEYIPEIAQVLAEIKGVSVEEVANKTSENSCRLFGLDQLKAQH